ncbi:helix-turn-helix transcriptional regulator [Saccharothrix syringae]|uniref:Helix-turn-helix domain-containing protein n=1 Tax=Saccharothrix syringae TaxID=103733 RepID=A0A5Q0H501_SACSY|nr:helix-turn-helix domain-containing protein [Saccharothrix syringae]QFZ21014.1 helix-turn-helix domain-containing protein [Saccharothrix syringae]
MHPPVRDDRVITDPEQAHALVAASYADNRLRVSGSTEGFRFEHGSVDLGDVRFDSIHNTLTTDYALDPVGRLMVCRVLEHGLEVEADHGEQRLGPGDTFLVARPDRGYRARLHGTRFQITNLELPLLDRLAPDASRDLVRGLRYEPLAPDRARYWQDTVDYVSTALLGNREAATSPLVLGSAGRLLAATLLTAFSPGAPAARPADRTDAVPATVRRAIAYLEGAPDLDLGVADIARACHVSVRALQLAFRRHLGTTPLGYLRRVRLDRVRTDLRDADPTAGATVTAIATRWGFLPDSRFRAHYRAAYHELPGDTLRR